ncbi:twitching motility protein PilT [Mycobacterium sp. 1164966.3]|uniref:PIN domain-containing protein n=1 Tax=Mycobacterium sp. 1164966.3 TaxID=1856861 RepID=UPI0007FF7F3E|nr:PIN domain-containing protein [Mycobacterium sp. 1164966.3]OBA78644.1 twitching motility protein PilT [Mycobacterium sp. 1164966.3]
MALIARYIVDTSAAARMQHPGVSQRIVPLIAAGLVATTAALDAEALYSARTSVEYEQRWAVRRDAYEYLPTGDEHWHIALGAQRDLARVGMHRSVGMTDLLTAALAAAHNLTVIHYDANFDIATTVLAFQHQWVIPRGAL